MKVTRFDIEGLVHLEPKIFHDRRGFFYEAYNEKTLAEAGIVKHFVQDNISRSAKGTLRGLHYQLRFPQAKLVSVLHGEVYDVAVDMRRNSPTFGHWAGVVLSGERRNQFYVPEGFAHGFQVLSDTADFFYKCSDFWRPEDEHGVLWSDADLGIDWPDGENPVLSPKDLELPSLKNATRFDL